MDLLPRWRVISLVFLLGCVISRTSGYWWTKEKISETPNLDKADLYLDTAEDIIVKIAKTIKSSGKAGQAVLATGALLYGGQFKYTSLQVQAFRLTGWAQTKEGLEVLLKSYRETRKAVRSEYPNLMKAKDELDLNSASIQEYRRILQLGKEGEMDMKEVLLSRKNLEKALVTRDAIKASMSSFDAIREALDLPALQKVVMGMQTGALSVFSVANSNTIGKMALGFSMSDILYKSLGWEKADLEELQRKIGEDSNFLRKLGNFSPKARRSSALEWSRHGYISLMVFWLHCAIRGPSRGVAGSGLSTAHTESVSEIKPEVNCFRDVFAAVVCPDASSVISSTHMRASKG
ncbi:unnamed protein product [Discosporangium mesarthrocarpum]